VVGELAVRTVPATDPSFAAVADAAGAVMDRAYGSGGFRARVERFSLVQPEGFAVVEEEAGRVVGAGCCIAYRDGGFGWIGLVATEPSEQRRGIGRLVTHHLAGVLRAHGCASVLDASAAGAPLYRHMGFSDHGPTTVLVADAAEGPSPSSEVSIARPDDLDEVAAFDVARFGGSRRSLLAHLLAGHPGRAAVTRASSGALTGYVVAQADAVGPLVVDDDRAVEPLVRFALALPWSVPPRLCAPPESRHLAALTALGFVARRELRNMRLGIDTLPGDRGACAAEVSLGEG
jgi:predicted N-acetyltransferase YhbS